jgi:hypothetical protein
MAQDTKPPPDPGVESAREAAPSPSRAAPEPPGGALTSADAAGERTREEHPPERSGDVTPAPPRVTGPDVNDPDRLEDATDRFLGESSDHPVPHGS